MLANPLMVPHPTLALVAGTKEPSYPLATDLVNDVPIPLKEKTSKILAIESTYLYVPNISFGK